MTKTIYDKYKDLDDLFKPIILVPVKSTGILQQGNRIDIEFEIKNE